MKLRACLYLLIVSSVLFTIAACNRDNNDAPALAPEVGRVGFVNLIPYEGSINLYINGTRQNVNKIGYNEYSGYMNMNAGQQNISFKTDSLRTEIFPTTPYTIPADAATMFVTGKTNSVVTIITRDTAVADTGGAKAKLRFVHAAADAPAYDILFNNVSIANQSYKSISKFVKVDTGKVAIKLNLAGTSTTVIHSSITFQSRSVYTFFIYGSIAGTGVNGLNLGIIANR